MITALLAIGVPLAPVMAFWLASPLMDPSMFFLTAGVLGPQYAVAKTIAAIGVGLVGGFGILACNPSARSPVQRYATMRAMAAALVPEFAIQRKLSGVTGTRRPM